MLSALRLDVDPFDNAGSPAPFDLDLQKLHSRIDSSDEDELLQVYIGAAVSWAEGAMHRTIFQRSHRWVLRDFPVCRYSDIRLPRGKASSLKGDRKLDALLRGAMEAASDDSGWAHLGAVGSNLVRLAPDFDSRTYGYRKLKDLVAKHPAYLVEERPSADGKTSAIYIRAK